MGMNLKEARLLRNMTTTQVANHIGVRQPAVTAWETGERIPPVEKLIKLADLYDVTVDYLLGRNCNERITEKEPVSPKAIHLLDGMPVWVLDHGWALVDASKNELFFSRGNRLPVNENLTVYVSPPHFTTSMPSYKIPLPQHDIVPGLEIMLEPVSEDKKLREMLRGYYKTKDGYAENQAGNRFPFDTYGIHWLAFKSSDK